MKNVTDFPQFRKFYDTQKKKNGYTVYNLRTHNVKTEIFYDCIVIQIWYRCTDSCVAGPTRDNSCHSENGAAHTRWSIGSSFSRELPQNLSTVSSVVSSDIDRWLSSEVLAPLASREDSKLTEEIRRSRSFCFGEFQNLSFESESRPVSCEFVIGQDTIEDDSLNSEEGLLVVSKEEVTEFSENKSTTEQDSGEFFEEVFNSGREQREHRNHPAPHEETQIDEISQFFESQIQENSQVDLQDKLSDLIDKIEPAARLEPDEEKQKLNTIEPDEKHEPEKQDADKEIEPEIKEADKTKDLDKLKQDENHEPSKHEELDPDKLESKKRIKPEKSEPYKNQEQSDERLHIEKPEFFEELEPNKLEPEKKQNVNKSNSIDDQELDKTEQNKLEQGKLEPGDNQKLHTSVPEEKLNQEQNSEETDNLIPTKRQEFKKLEADGTQFHYQIDLYKLEPEEKQERDNSQKLDKLEPEQTQEPCKFEPDEKEEQKEKQKHRNVHSDELEQNGKQDSEKLEVVKYKQEKKRETNKLKPGEDQETNIPQSNTNLPLYTKESIYPEKLDSRNCTKNSESLECLLFQHQTQREASDENGASIDTETEGEHNAVNSKQSTNTCIAKKNLKDNDSLDKEKESVFCKDTRKEKIYSKDKLEEDNVIIDKGIEESKSIDKREEESFSKDKVVKDVFGIDKGEEENKKIYREENENAKIHTEKEILDNIDEWEEKVSIHKVEEEDESDKDNESLEKLEETEIPDGVCPGHEIDLNCDPYYLEEGSTKCSSGNEELTSTLNEEKECLPLIRPKNSQTDQSNQGTQNTYWDSFPSDSLDVNQRSHQEYSEKQIDSATILKGSESKQTFGVSAQDHRHEIVPMKEEEEQICVSKRNLNNETTDVETKSNSEENNQKEGLEAQENCVMEDNIDYSRPSEAVHKSKEGIVKEQNSVHSNSVPLQNEQRSVAQNKMENVNFLADNNIASPKSGDMEESENAPISKKRHMIQHSSNFNVGNEDIEDMENLPVKETGSSERYEIKKQQSLDDGLKMESRSRKQSLPDSMIRSQGKKSKQFKRMNSDSAVMYEKSRYSLGILLEEINDLVRRTSSFECSDLDIRYKPTTDKSSHRMIQQSEGKGNPGGKAPQTSGDENLLQLVEMYGDKQGKKSVDGSGGAAAVSKVEYTANSPDGVFYDNENSEPREAEAQKSIIDNLDNVIGVSDSLNEFAKHTDGKNNSEMKRKAFCKKKSVGENSIQRYDDKKEKNLVDKSGSDNTHRPSDGGSSNCEAVNPLKDESSDSSKVLDLKPPSVASKKEQRRRFPLRMLRRKSSVTSLSMLDVDEMADSSATGTDVVPASTMTQDSQRRRKCSVVGYNDMGQGAGLLFQGGERGTERAALRGEATHRRSSGTSFGRNGNGCTAAQSRRKSHQRNLSGNFPSFDTSSASKTSGTFSDLKGSSLIGRNPSLDNRCLKEDSISHLDRRASSQFEPSNFKQFTQRETSDTRKSVSTKDYHRNDGDGSREASLSNRHGRNSQDRRSSTYSQEHSKAIDGEKKQFPLLKDNASSSLSYCRELSSATDGGRKGQFPHSKTISTEGYSAFNKVGAMGNEKNRLTQYNQKLKGIAAIFRCMLNKIVLFSKYCIF